MRISVATSRVLLAKGGFGWVSSQPFSDSKRRVWLGILSFLPGLGPSRMAWWDIPTPCLRFHPQLEETAARYLPRLYYLRLAPLLEDGGFFGPTTDDCEEDWEDSPVLCCATQAAGPMLGQSSTQVNTLLVSYQRFSLVRLNEMC
ncbi:uncharacterized protein LAJ45_07203 [Morchella importuna]|uniref:uncharacterized protein n=1 Tax=Morchella importuna TaxID=1174673 RepID=UPI001E8E0758|nr:uncharacterized protein LAJ45_07203 [Morchella importuna]KAH8148860.1 hypothetical protein LAJ45_07203 [Morchella importuna]